MTLAPVRNPTQQQQQRSVFTKSSEDLLRDYGLDFSKLSMVSNIDFDGAVSQNRCQGYNSFNRRH
jgi:hypothetical protein